MRFKTTCTKHFFYFPHPPVHLEQDHLKQFANPEHKGLEFSQRLPRWSCGITRANHKPESTSSHEPTSSQPRVKSIFLNFAPPKNIWISREHIAGYRLSQQLTTGYFDNKLSAIATRERVASFLIFVPFDLETTITVEGWCLQNFISVAKLHSVISYRNRQYNSSNGGGVA